MMDISDGLVLSLYDMADANECGFSVDSTLLPLLEAVNPNKSTEYALHGGGDFELLFTCSPYRLPVPDVEVTVIGTVIKEHKVMVDGSAALQQGYLHQWKN
jgi:thiamine-monophosphate kinase